MTAPKLPEATGWMGDPTRGAQLGRIARGAPSPASTRFYLTRVRLNSGGYDDGGAYWGVGAPLYWASSADSLAERFLRAGSREDAKAKIREAFPHATFFR